MDRPALERNKEALKTALPLRNPMTVDNLGIASQLFPTVKDYGYDTATGNDLNTISSTPSNQLQTQGQCWTINVVWPFLKCVYVV